MIGNTEEVSERVRMLQADIGLIEGHTNENELEIEPFMEDEMCIAAPNQHPLAGRRDISISDLQNEAWVTREKGSGTREYLDHVLSSNGLRPKSMFTISEQSRCKRSGDQRHGAICSIQKRASHKDLIHREISILHIKDFSLKRKLSYIHSPLMENTKIKKFLLRC